MPAHEPAMSFADYILQTAFVAYYFVYFLFRTSPALLDETEDQKCLQHKSACCVHATEQKKHQSPARPEPAKPAAKTKAPARAAPAKDAAASPTYAVKETVYKTVSTGQSLVKNAAKTLSSSSQSLAAAAKDKLNIFSRIQIFEIKDKKPEQPVVKKVEPKQAAAPPPPPAVVPQVQSYAAPTLASSKVPAYPSALFGGAQSSPSPPAPQGFAPPIPSAPQGFVPPVPQGPSVPVLKPVELPPAFGAREEEPPQLGFGFQITEGPRSGPMPFAPGRLDQSKVSKFDEQHTSSFVPPAPPPPPVIEHQPPVIIKPKAFIGSPAPFAKASSPKDPMDNTISKLQHIAEDSSQAYKSESTFVMGPKVFREPSPEPPRIWEPQQPQLMSFGVVAEPREMMYEEERREEPERASSVTNLTRQWPPPSNATGVEIVKDIWPPGEGVDLSQSWHGNPGHQGAYYDTVAEQSIFQQEDVPRAVRNPQGDVQDYGKLERQYGELVTNMMSPEKSHELSKLLLDAEGKGRGLQMFTNRREQADRWALENAPTPTPDDVHKAEEVVEAVHDAAARKEGMEGPFAPVMSGPSSSIYQDSFSNPPMLSPPPVLQGPPSGFQSAALEEMRSSVRLFSPQPFSGGTGTAPPYEPPRHYEARGPFEATAVLNSHQPGEPSFSMETFNSLPRDWRSWSQQYGGNY